jgi:release factor glutamine methyltransferase
MSTVIKYTLNDAEELIRDIGGYDPITEAKDLLNKAESDEQFSEYLDRRINNHEPVAYITNHARFGGIDLYIDPRVLIPRSETEALLQVAIDEVPHLGNVADIGTGCGAIALALKNERPDINVVGLDISKDALDVASINSTALGLEVEWRDADLLEGVKEDFGSVLANMPYLPTAKRDTYAPEMVDFEPQVALWGGSDGYDLIRRLLAQAQARPVVKLVALEIGLGQEDDVCELVRSTGFPTVFCTKDKRGDTRCVVGKR